MQISCHRFLKYWVSLLLIPSKSRTKGWKQVNTDVPGGGPVGDAEIRGHWGWSYSPKAPQEQHQEKHGFWNTEKPLLPGMHLLPEMPLLPGTSLFPEMHPLPGEPGRALPMPTLGRASARVRTQRPCIITHGNRPQLSRKGISLVKTKENMAGETFKKNSIQKVGNLKFYNIVILIKPRCQEKHYTIK